MIRERMLLVITLCLASFFLPSEVFAAGSGASGAAGGGLWIALGIAYLTRKRMIGGWLFYYYLRLYGGLAFLLLTTAATFGDFQPSVWDDKALYTLFMISALPYYLFELIEAITASLLLSRRYRLQKYVDYLRYTLIGQMVVAGLTLFIDYHHFTENVPITIMGGVFAVIWYFYFSNSYRVYCVLSHGDWNWNYEEFRQSKAQSKGFRRAS